MGEENTLSHLEIVTSTTSIQNVRNSVHNVSTMLVIGLNTEDY